VSIASRYPVTGSWEVGLAVTPRTAGFAATTLVAEVDAPPPVGPLLFANHLPSWQPDFERERELQVPGRARTPVRRATRFVPENPLGADWDWPFRRIDYLLVRCGEHGGPTLAIRSCERVFDEAVDGVWASDRFGLTADLTVPGR
jgi:hypothetical protein